MGAAVEKAPFCLPKRKRVLTYAMPAQMLPSWRRALERDR